MRALPVEALACRAAAEGGLEDQLAGLQIRRISPSRRGRRANPARYSLLDI